MVEGTREYKKLECMIKEVDQRREKDSARIDVTLEEIKAMINGLTMQHNEMRSQASTQKDGKWLILGNLGPLHGESIGQAVGNSPFKYSTKLEFSKFGGEGVEEWLFKVEQFFLLDKTLEHAKISVVSLHFEGSVFQIGRAHV